MKKLLIATDTYFPKRDGVTTFLANVLPKLAKRYKIKVVAPNFGRHPEFRDVAVVKMPLGKREISGYSAANPNHRVIKRLTGEADIVWVQSFAPIGVAAARHAAKQKKPLIAYMHVIEAFRFVELLDLPNLLKKALHIIAQAYERRFYKKFKIIMVSSQQTAKILRSIGLERTTVVPLGVDSKKFKEAKDKQKAKEKMGLQGKLVICYSGRLSKEKNLQTLIKAFKRLKPEFKNLFLLIVGDGPERYLFEDLPDCKVTSVVDDIVPYLHASDIYVMPSLTETTSLSTLEAMSCGIPVVSTPVGYIKDIITNAGYIFPRRDVKYLTEILKNLILNEDLRIALGRNARKAVKKFSWGKTVRAIEKIFRRFC